MRQQNATLSANGRSILYQPSVDQVIDVCVCAVTSKQCIRDIGVLLDDTTSMMNQVRRVYQVAYYHIRSITLIRRCLTTNGRKTIVSGLVMLHLDYAKLYDLPEAVVDLADGPELATMTRHDILCCSLSIKREEM